MVRKYRTRRQPWRVRHMSSPLPIISESSSSGYDPSSLFNSVNSAFIIGSDNVEEELYLRALTAVQAAKIVVQSTQSTKFQKIVQDHAIKITNLEKIVQDQAAEIAALAAQIVVHSARITKLKNVVQDQAAVIAAMMERLSNLESKASVSPVRSQGIS